MALTCDCAITDTFSKSVHRVEPGGRGNDRNGWNWLDSGRMCGVVWECRIVNEIVEECVKSSKCDRIVDVDEDMQNLNQCEKTWLVSMLFY